MQMTMLPAGIEHVSGEDLDLLYDADFAGAAEATAWFDALAGAVPWRRETVSLFGQRHRAPRLTAWFGDEGVAYRYSGVEHVAAGWTPLLLEIRQRVQVACGAPFNAVLLNYYRDGDDCVGWHSDDEPSLGDAPVIASVSVGGPRRFRLRRRPGASATTASPAAPPRSADARRTRTLLLSHGSLLVMRGRTQAAWQHCVPRCAHAAPRVNLTFRHVRAAR
jgi:alkylated DNA repair dioxygenase AlkB